MAYIKGTASSGTRKQSHLACSPKAPVSPMLGRGCSLIFRTLFSPAPLRFAEGPQGVVASKSPPRLALHQHGTGLAAQAAFPSGPFPGFHKILD